MQEGGGGEGGTLDPATIRLLGTENGEGSEEEGEGSVTRWDVAEEDASDTEARGQGIEMEVEEELPNDCVLLRIIKR